MQYGKGKAKEKERKGEEKDSKDRATTAEYSGTRRTIAPRKGTAKEKVEERKDKEKENSGGIATIAD